MSAVLGIIPARFESTRLARKMLLPIAGKPLVYYTWKQAQQSSILDAVVVATDAYEIRDAVRLFGGDARMTAPSCRSGTDRVAEAARAFKKFNPDIVVNIQGDEPLISPEAITAAVQMLTDDPSAVLSTAAVPLSEKLARQPHLVKVVCDDHANALYFSRACIPYPRNHSPRYLQHIGVYAFRTRFLYTYASLPQTPLEKIEGLEQLRALEHGYTIKVAVGNFISVGVDTKKDYIRVRAIIEKSIGTH